MSSNVNDALNKDNDDEDHPQFKAKKTQEYFSANFKKRLNHLWHDCLFCDVTLEVEGKMFKCHKIILASNSHYFESMFSNGMSETSQNIIKMKDISSNVMENILNYMYCEFPSLPTYEVDDAIALFKAVDMLQIDNGMKDALREFLFFNTDDDNCFTILHLTQFIRDDILRCKAYGYAISDFETVSKSPGFLELEKDMLVSYLKDDDLFVNKEENIFHNIVRWINQDPKKRKTYAPELFDCVRYCFIEPKVLIDEIGDHEFMDEFPCLRNRIFAALRHQTTPCYQHEDHYYKCKPRYSDISLCIVNPVRDDNQFETDVFDTQDELHFRTVVTQQENNGKKQACLIGSQMYVFDGKTLNKCNMEKPDDILWNKCESPPNRHGYQALKEYTLTLCGDFIYLIGGKTQSGVCSSIDFYDYKMNVWKAPPDAVQALIHPVSGHRAVAFKGDIYLIGGYQPDSITGSKFLQIYDSINGKITLGPYASDTFMCHSVVCYEGEIFVFSPQRKVAKYNPTIKQWTRLQPSTKRIPRFSVSVAINSNIIILGGTHRSSKNTDDVWEYDPETDTFELLTQLSTAVRISSVVKSVDNKYLTWL
ncbi:unnamed protein product [Owenia fusiformis]|uniref:Uncharacterized protein n=1 Tax=Owenia fusiformis TaxID=6347 RepID=A0A8J1XTD3_OWEFU|nr:unnamed protein product [Owenia fusiformis]